MGSDRYDRGLRFRKDAKVDLLSRVPLLAACSKKELGMIANLADVIDFPEGKTLMRAGDQGWEFFILVDGTVRVSQGGRKHRDLAAGDWVGEIALIANVARTATVVTTSPVRALVLTRGGFSQLIGDVPSIAAKVLAALGERLAPETI
jgi:CRP-like cAMP-binding protein